MKLNGKFLKTWNTVTMTVGFAVMGVLAIVFGVLLTSSRNGDFVETQAVITEIRSTGEDSGEVYVSYTADGKEYNSLLDSYSTSYKVGDSLTVRYDPADPTVIQTPAGIISFILFGAGAVMLLLAVRCVLVRRREKAEDVRQEQSYERLAEEKPIELDPEQETHYFYQPVFKSGAQSGFMDDEQRRVICEAQVQTASLLKAQDIVFINHVTCSSRVHKVGHTVNKENDNVVVESTFTFDGEDIWSYLHRSGIRISTEITPKNLSATYTVTYCGRLYATVTTSGTDVHGTPTGFLQKLGAKGYYKVTAYSTELDLLFLTVFALARTEKTIYD